MDGPGLVMLMSAVFAPLTFGLLTIALPRSSANVRALVASLGPVTAAALVITQVQTHGFDANPAGFGLVTSIGMDIAFVADRLGAFFALLVSIIGLLIVGYARGYFGADGVSLRRFYPLLGFFATAMLGIVLSDSLLGMFLFWELTTVSSFLLIGWNWSDRTAARLATQALVVTGTGGIALLGGLVALGVATGSSTFSGLEAAVGQADGVMISLAFGLLFMGAAAKSAQWPLHFWLPGAMAAPTPVSAYLHSATMVKAGVYLLARLYPSMHTLDAWAPVLISFGAITMLLGAFLALRSDELKKIFAYTTVSQLGLLVCAYGVGAIEYHHESNLIWPVTQILNHALYKAPLFIIAGAIAVVCGRKYLSQLGGLFRSAPLLSVVCLLALYAMAGGPLTLSFIAKEAFFYQVYHAAKSVPWVWVVALMGIGTAMCNVAIFVRFVSTVFGPAHQEHLGRGHAHERGLGGMLIWLPALIIVSGQYVGGLAPGVFESVFGSLESSKAYFKELPSLWYAITHPGIPLVMSVIAIVGGIALGVLPLLRGTLTDPHNAIVPALMRGLEVFGYRTFGMVQTGNVRWYIAASVGMILVMVVSAGLLDPRLFQMPDIVWVDGWRTSLTVGLLALLVCITAVLVGWNRTRIVRILMLGACGFCVTAMYLFYQAPDLALTQIMFELISIILFLLVMRLLPEGVSLPRDAWRLPRAVFAGFAGLALGWLVLSVGTGVDKENAQLAQAAAASQETRTAEHVSPASLVVSAADTSEKTSSESFEGSERLGAWFLKHSYKGTEETGGRGGGGDNVVNVILVDFRGYDTLGEITVLAIAMIGVMSLLFAAGPAVLFAPGGPQPKLRSSLLQTAMRLVLPLSMVFAAYVFFKGHQLPGGGFIAGLIASVGFAIFRMCYGGGTLHRLIPLRPGTLAAIGLSIALATGVAPMLAGPLLGIDILPLLRSTHFYIPLVGGGTFHFTSVLFFDLGVFLVVIAVAVGMINRFEEELE